MQFHIEHNQKSVRKDGVTSSEDSSYASTREATRETVFQKYLDPLYLIGNDAFGELCQQVCTKVVRGVIGRSYPEHIKDVVQEASIKAVFHLKDFDGRSNINTWLNHIAHNAAVDFTRNISRHPDRDAAHMITTDDITPGLDAQISIASDLNTNRMESSRLLADNILKNLRLEDAEILKLFYINELSLVEIQNYLKLDSLGAVKTKLSRARERALAYADKKHITVGDIL
jgi:RNA polymerase sigma factor (sigma-70 family)